MTPQEFIKTYNGKYLDTDNHYGRQCWDLAQKAAEVIAKCTTLPTGGDGAYGVFKNFLYPLPNYYRKVDYKKTRRPKLGDLVVWGASQPGSNGNGHIAMFVKATNGGFISFDQNWPIGSPCHLQEHTWVHVVGWLRWKVNDGKPTPKPKPHIPARKYIVLDSYTAKGLSYIAKKLGWRGYASSETWTKLASLNGWKDWKAYNKQLKVGLKVYIN